MLEKEAPDLRLCVCPRFPQASTLFPMLTSLLIATSLRLMVVYRFLLMQPSERNLSEMEFTPENVAAGAGAAKAAFEAIRNLLGVFKDAKDLLPIDKQEAAALAIETSAKQIAIAEAEVARALGYELCHCEFPPTIMLAVGYHSRPVKAGQQVFECSKCDYNTAAPMRFERFGTGNRISI